MLTAAPWTYGYKTILPFQALTLFWAPFVLLRLAAAAPARGARERGATIIAARRRGGPRPLRGPVRAVARRAPSCFAGATNCHENAGRSTRHLRRHARVRGRPARRPPEHRRSQKRCSLARSGRARPALADQQRPARPGVRVARRRARSACALRRDVQRARWRWRSPIRALGLTGEVIVPSFTFVATAHALHWQRVTPVFCDVDPRHAHTRPGRGRGADHAADHRHHRRPPVGRRLRRRRRSTRSGASAPA